MADPVRYYGVRERTPADDVCAHAIEDLRLSGYTVLDGGYSDAELATFSDHFDEAQEHFITSHGGREALTRIDEHNTIRAMLAVDPLFLDLARNDRILNVCEQMLGPYFVLNQQNGIVNPPHGERYNQGAFHRDLPYQHFVSSRPLALNALFCVDDFTLENGATLVLPSTHKQEAFPSDDAVRRHATQISASRGTFIILDCMVYHSGGINRTPRRRRAVNHVYSIPMLRQQLNLPALLGPRYADDATLAPFLGYHVREPDSVEAYLAERRRKLLGPQA